MLRFIFETPLWIAGPVLVLLMAGASLAGLLVTRRWVLPRLRVTPEDSEFIGTMVQGVLVFYGLAIALIAVSVWESYSQVTQTVSEEATTLGALYRDVSTYPEPQRSAMQGILRDYVHNVIHEAWPLQQRGEVPTGGVSQMNRFQTTLAEFQPSNEGQSLMHAETLRAYNLMIHARRMRLDAVNTGLPVVMWLVIILGGAVSMTSTFFFSVQDVRLHAIMVTLVATFMSLVIFMILALDHPFLGDLGVSADSYRLIYEQLMKP